MYQIPTSQPTTSSLKSCMIGIYMLMKSLPIILVIVSLCWVSILLGQEQSDIFRWDLIAILMSITIWIGTYFLAAHLAIKSLIGIIFLVLIRPLFWNQNYVIGLWCHTGIDSLDNYQISHKIKIFYLSLNVPNCSWNILLHSAQWFWEVSVLWIPFVLCQ